MDNEVILSTVIEVVELYAEGQATVTPDIALLETGVIDSLNMLQIVIELERRLKMRIGAVDLVYDDFYSPRQLADAITRLASH